MVSGYFGSCRHNAAAAPALESCCGNASFSPSPLLKCAASRKRAPRNYGRARCVGSRTGTRRKSEDLDAIAEYKELSARHSQLRGVLSPLRTFPPELLSEIFGHTQASTKSLVEEYAEHRVFSLNSIPWALTRVSSRWREVASRTRALWSPLVLIFGRGEKPHPLPLLEIHLQRAQYLSISFQSCYDHSKQEQIEAFRLLAQYSERWSSLFMFMTSDLLPIFNALRGQLPTLHKLRIEWEGPEDSTEATGTITCLETAPVLTHLRLGGPGYPGLTPTQVCPANLTRYSVDAIWSLHAQVLPLAPNIKWAYIQIVGEPDDSELWTESTANSPILIPQLSHLYVSDPQILYQLTAPSLNHIAFRSGDEEQDGKYVDVLTEHIKRSGASLQSIRVAGEPSVGGIHWLLTKFPSITDFRLVFDTDNFDWDNVHLIMEMLETEHLQIRRLFFYFQGSEFDYRPPQQLAVDTFLTMVCARSDDLKTPLEKVELVLEEQHFEGRKIRRGLHKLKEENGLQSVFINGGYSYEKARERCLFVCENSNV
ncbi:hypothetical protein MKEN_01228500 [Mycena kentingensis (nom. inval.)]|nr:hypothetical protein MKEN_01228500 [Mycena kentingensis (nom. inval.)]